MKYAIFYFSNCMCFFLILVEFLYYLLSNFYFSFSYLFPVSNFGTLILTVAKATFI